MIRLTCSRAVACILIAARRRSGAAVEAVRFIIGQAGIARPAAPVWVVALGVGCTTARGSGTGKNIRGAGRSTAAAGLRHVAGTCRVATHEIGRLVPRVTGAGTITRVGVAARLVSTAAARRAIRPKAVVRTRRARPAALVLLGAFGAGVATVRRRILESVVDARACAVAHVLVDARPSRVPARRRRAKVIG